MVCGLPQTAPPFILPTVVICMACLSISLSVQGLSPGTIIHGLFPPHSEIKGTLAAS